MKKIPKKKEKKKKKLAQSYLLYTCTEKDDWETGIVWVSIVDSTTGRRLCEHKKKSIDPIICIADQ